MKVCFLVKDYPSSEKSAIVGKLGGVLKAPYYLSQSLREIGADVHVITEKTKGLTEHEQVGEVHVHRLAKQHLFGFPGCFIYNMSEARVLSKIERNYGKFDVIHAAATATGIALWKKSGKLKASYIVSVHGTIRGEFKTIDLRLHFGLRDALDKYLNGPVQQRVDEFNWRVADRVIAVSKAERRELIEESGIPSEKVEVIYNGVDLERYRPSVEVAKIAERLELENNRVILFVGRLVYKKGAHILLEAFQGIKREIPDARLLIIGKGPLECFFKGRATNLGIANSVIFEHDIPEEDLPKYYAIAQVFVAPPLTYEPFPLTVLEAMASGKPVVVSDVGGLPEVVEPGRTGFIVAQNDPRSLASAILTIMQNDALHKKMSTEARKVVEKDFSWKRIAEETLKLYEGSLGKGKGEG